MLKGRRHESLARNGTDPGIARSVVAAKSLMEVHEAATFGKAGKSSLQGLSDLTAQAAVGFEVFGIEFRIAAAQIKAVTRRQRPIMQGAEKNQFGTAAAEDVKAVFIVKAKKSRHEPRR